MSNSQTDTHAHTHWQASDKCRLSGGEKIVWASVLTLTCSPVDRVRAGITASCQGKCQEMFVWGDCQVPVGNKLSSLVHPLTDTHTHLKSLNEARSLNKPTLTSLWLGPLSWSGGCTIHPPGVFSYFLSCLFKDKTRLKTEEMTKRKTKVRTNSDNKMLDVSVNTGVTLCQPRMNPWLLAHHPEWRTYWREKQSVCYEQCVCVCVRCVNAVSLSLRLALAWGLKHRCIIEQWRLLTSDLCSASHLPACTDSYIPNTAQQHC